MFDTQGDIPENGFNRYMVECEYNKLSSEIVGIYCFNRYMVECEYRNHNCGNPLFIVLIDTWWNVNYFN